jgi:hypothetical protein
LRARNEFTAEATCCGCTSVRKAGTAKDPPSLSPSSPCDESPIGRK